MVFKEMNNLLWEFIGAINANWDGLKSEISAFYNRFVLIFSFYFVIGSDLKLMETTNR